MKLAGANPGPFEFRSPERSGRWEPRGRLQAHGTNPRIAWRGPNSVVARIFVGFNICQEPKWKMPDLVKIVREIRLMQVGDPGASFIVQRGLYKDQPPPGEKDCGIVEEDSAQVLIYHDVRGQTFRQFKSQIIFLAGEIAKRLRQRSVILEFQKNGQTEEVMGVQP